MKNKNIWYIHHYAAPYEMAGLHRPYIFGEYFKKMEADVTVFSSSYMHFAAKQIIKNRDLFVTKDFDGIMTVFVKACEYANSGLMRIRNLFEFAINVKKVANRLIKSGNIPDLIIASSPNPLSVYSGIKIAKKLGIPCLCEVRDLWPEVFFYGGKIHEKSLFGRILLRGERYLYEHVDGILFLKEGDYSYLIDHKWDVGNGGKISLEKCYYVNNGVDLKRFDKQMSENPYSDVDLLSSKFKIVYCGTIRPVNNVDMLLDVGKYLGDKADILIYGSGSCVVDLEKRVSDENITNVKLKGYIDNKYVPSLLSQSDLNILNYSGSAYNWSRGNSSNKLFEYLASSKPVISTVKMGYDIIERYNCGVSAEKCTSYDISNAIQYIIDMPRDEYNTLCNNARKAATHFDIPVLAKKYMDIIDNMIKENKKNG